MTIFTFARRGGGGSGPTTQDFEFLSKTDLSGGTATSITLSGLSAFNDYLFQLQYETSLAGFVELQFNGDTGANYNRKYSVFFGTTSQVGGEQVGDNSIPLDNQGASQAGVIDVRVTRFNDGWHIRSHGDRDRDPSGPTITFASGMWLDTSQITSATVFTSAGVLETKTELLVWGIRDS